MGRKSNATKERERLARDVQEGESVNALHPVSNEGAVTIATTEPYLAKLTIEGTTPLLFHRWNVEAVAEKASAAKNSRGKKEDNVESYVYRDQDGHICLPGEYLRQSIIHAAKYLQDPRSPRKSAMDLYEAGILMETELAPLQPVRVTWDYIDQRRVVVQGNGVTRSRPAFHKGWRASFEMTIILPEYITRTVLGQVIQNAGRLIGVGDLRPTYGRYMAISFM